MRLTFIASGSVWDWYDFNIPGEGGCQIGGGYKQFLLAGK